jgi:hypothetical protein
MGNSKLQIVLATGVIAVAGVALQAGVPRLANGASLLFLRAQYKLATGDTRSALQLMQQAATLKEKGTPPTSPQACPYVHATPIVRVKKPVSAVHVVSVRMANANRAPVRQLVLKVPDSSVKQARMLAQIRLRQAEQARRLQVSMAKLQAQLKDLPVPVSLPAIATPTISVPVP